MTIQINPLAVRVIRPFVAGILTLSLMQAIAPKTSDPSTASAAKVIRIPAAIR